MRPTDRQIENLIQRLNDQTRPELDEKILNDCFTELATLKSPAPAEGTPIWGIIMRSKRTKLVAAVIVLVTVSVGLLHW